MEISARHVPSTERDQSDSHSCDNGSANAGSDAKRCDAADERSTSVRKRAASEMLDTSSEAIVDTAVKRRALACCICHKVIHRDSSSNPMIKQPNGVFAIVEEERQVDCLFSVDSNLFDKSPYACNRCAARNREQSKVMCAICGLERPASTVKHDVSMKDGVVFIGHRECVIPTASNDLSGISNRACGGCYAHNVRCLEKTHPHGQYSSAKELAALQVQCDNLRRDMADAGAKHDASRAALSALNATLQGQVEDFKRLIAIFEDSKPSNDSEDVASLRQEVVSLKQALEASSAKMSALEEVNKELQKTSANELAGFVETIRQLVATKDEAVAGRSKHVEDLEPEVLALRRAMSRRYQSDVANEMELTRTRAELKRVTNEKETIERHVREHIAESKAQNARLASMCVAMEEATKKANQATEDAKHVAAKFIGLQARYNDLVKSSAGAQPSTLSSTQSGKEATAIPSTSSLYRMDENGTFKVVRGSVRNTNVITSALDVTKLFACRTKTTPAPCAYLHCKAVPSDSLVPLFFEVDMSKLREADPSATCKSMPINVIDE